MNAREIAHRLAPDWPPSAIWLNSSPLTWDQLAGKTVLVYFLSLTSKDMRSEFKRLKRWEAAYSKQDLRIIAVQEASGDADQTKKLARELKISFPVVLDREESVGAAYGHCPVPSAFVIGANRLILEVENGKISEPALEEAIRRDSTPSR